ncbi:MAG: HD domain-containing protein [Bdellovibrionales bacterium]|nr:HD domain-containing protein [Bdellovibrionales bacterium]
MAAKSIPDLNAPIVAEVIVVSKDDNITKFISPKIEKFGIKIRIIKDLNEVLKTEFHPTRVVIVDAQLESNDTLIDVLRVFRETHKDSELVVSYSGRLTTNIENLFTSGARAAFQMPFETELLVNYLFEVYKPETSHMDMDALVQVSMIDFENCKTFPFDTFICLPFNKKIFLYRRRNSEVDNETIAKFKAKDNFPVYIQRKDLPSYHDFFAQRLAEIHASDAKTGGQELQKSVTSMLKGVFSKTEVTKEDQTVMLDSVKKITMNLLKALGKDNSYLEKVSSLCSQSFSNYSHAANVAAYSALFGFVLGYEDPSDLFLGGLLHDIGHSEIVDLTKDFEEDKNHTLTAIDILTQKGLDVPTEVQMMILQHHEHADGSGFPEGINAAQTHQYAKICALADYFDIQTSLQMGHFKQTPSQALMTFSGLIGGIPHPCFDPDFHDDIITPLLGNIGPNVSSEKSSDTDEEAA